MTCDPLNPLTCLVEGAGAVGDAVSTATDPVGLALAGIDAAIHTGLTALAELLASWLLVDTPDICPTTSTTWMSDCVAGTSPAVQVQHWLLPVTALVVVLGMLWQAILLTISRKGEPLLTILKGLGGVAVWGAVGIVGTQLVLRAADAYSTWILATAIGASPDNPQGDFSAALTGLAVEATPLGALVAGLVGVLFLVGLLVQIILLIFRQAALTILAGQLQLAAAGGFSRLTQGWLGRVLGWNLALLAYKPVAASVYAAGFALLRNGGSNTLAGLGMLILSLIALPALLKLFNWTVGTVGQSGGSMGMIASTVAAGLHGMAAMNTPGGNSAADHARWMAQQPNPGGGNPGGGADGARGGGRPRPGPAPTGGPTTGAPARPSGPTTGAPSHPGGAPSSATPPSGVAPATGATAAAGSAGTGSAASAAGSGGGAAAAAADGAAGAAAAAAGPVGAAVATGAVVADTAQRAATGAANAAGGAPTGGGGA